LPYGMKIHDFLKLPPEADIDVQIAAQTKALEAVRQAGELKKRAGLTEAAMPALPADFEALLGKTLDGIAGDAQKRKLATILLPNSVARGRIRRDEVTPLRQIVPTIQYFVIQVGTKEYGGKRISSAVLLIKPRTCKCLVGPR
jgi:hypothetical protein